MLNYMFEWIENVAFYMVLVVAFMQMIPGESYKKYIRFFVGLILILMLTGPLFKLLGINKVYNQEYKKEFEEIQEYRYDLEELIREETPSGE